MEFYNAFTSILSDLIILLIIVNITVRNARKALEPEEIAKIRKEIGELKEALEDTNGLVYQQHDTNSKSTEK